MKINLKFTKAAALTLAISAGVAASAVVASADTDYKVQAGDTISTIVQKYHLDMTAITKIAQINHLNDVNQLKPGQVIEIPDVDSLQPTNNNSNNGQNQPTKTNVQKDEATPDDDSTTNLSPAEQSAKDWIVWHESRGQYNVSNGQYYGKYQLDISYLNGDLSQANQDRTAQRYVQHRYGSWVNAKAHWVANGWY